MKPFILAWRLLIRDWKSGELTVLGIALIIAVTALTAVAFLTDRVGHAVELRAAESLAADLRLGSSQPIPDSYIEMAEQSGLQTASMITMPSVVFEQAPEEVFAVVEGLAAGAMLTVITQTMMPEALHRSGGFVGLAALAGFLFTTALGA